MAVLVFQLLCTGSKQHRRSTRVHERSCPLSDLVLAQLHCCFSADSAKNIDQHNYVAVETGKDYQDTTTRDRARGYKRTGLGIDHYSHFANIIRSVQNILFIYI